MTLRFGLVGAGNIAEFAMEELTALPDVVVTSLISRPSSRRDEFARSHQIAEVADDLERLEQLSADAYFVATPNGLHAEQSAQLLRAGKHVLLDKPLATSLEEAKKIEEALQTPGSGKFLLGMNFRFSEQAARLRGALRAGAIGEIFEARAAWCRRSGIPKLGSWFGHKELSGGGVLLDLGVHLLDLTFSLLDDFDCRSVTAVTRSAYGPSGRGGGAWGKSGESGLAFDVEDGAQALLLMSSGRTVTLDLAWAGPLGNDEPELTLVGTQGAIRFSDGKITSAPDSEETESFHSRPLSTDARPNSPNRFAHFCEMVRGEAEPEVTLSEALKVQAVIDAIYRSAETGTSVSFASG